MSNYIVWFEDLSMNDVPVVGGKNASLGEMIANLSSAGIKVPGGFATTAVAFREFLSQDGLDERINTQLTSLDVENTDALMAVGKNIRKQVLQTPFPEPLERSIRNAFIKLQGESEASVAVRSSATAEDLPEASFAGQQESFLNVVGIENVLHRIKEVFASLYNDRAISYRVHQGFEHAEVALSAGIQRMVRSNMGSSGVMFSIDTETGFEDVVFITSSWGLGECVVQGSVNPDEFYVHKQTLEQARQPILRRTLGSKLIKMVFDKEASVKTIDTQSSERARFSLTDTDVITLASMAVKIEKHYGRPMDIEWGKDGVDGELYILQARPETVE